MKNLANLNGVKTLNKNEQQSINGGTRERIWCYDYVINEWVYVYPLGGRCPHF